MLLCKTCNGRNGGLFDSLLIDHRQLGLRPGERIGKVKVGRSTARVAVSGGAKPEHMRFVLDDSPSRRMLQTWAKSLPFQVPVTITVGKDPAWRLTIAHLSIAYLTLVKYYLYAPVLMPAMDRVRAQILHPDERILPDVFVFPADGGTWGIYEDYGPLALPDEPRSLRGAVVRALDRMVMLPLALPGDVIYERLKTLVDLAPNPAGEVQVEYGNIAIPYLRNLLRAGIADQRFQLWRTEDGVKEAIIGGPEAEARGAAIGRSHLDQDGDQDH